MLIIYLLDLIDSSHELVMTSIISLIFNIRIPDVISDTTPYTSDTLFLGSKHETPRAYEVPINATNSHAMGN